MTNEERDLITKFFARMGGAGQQTGFSAGQQAPTPALPPIDREADQLIAEQLQRYPEARYRITQTAIVQEAALAESQNRIQRLQWDLDQARQQMQQEQQAAPSQSRGFLGNLFGGGQQRPQYQQPQYQQPMMQPPPPQYPPNYQRGMFGGGGSGFLGSALTTAAGVAGGMVVGNALMGAFEGHRSDGGGLGGAGGSPWDGAGGTVTDPTAGFGASQSDPWGGGQTASYDQSFDSSGGGFDNSGGGFDSSGGGFDGGGFDSSSS